MADLAEHCLACHTDNRGHYAHMNKGDCLKSQPEVQPPSSFQSLGEEAAPKEESTAALAEYGPPALGRPGIVVCSEHQMAEEEDEESKVLKAIQGLKDEMRLDRTELNAKIIWLQDELRHYVERADTFEHSLTSRAQCHERQDGAIGKRMCEV